MQANLALLESIFLFLSENLKLRDIENNKPLQIKNDLITYVTSTTCVSIQTDQDLH